MNIVMHDCEQGSPEWYRCRMGMPTASEFATVLAKGKNGGESLTRSRYMRTLAGEILTGEVADSYTNAHMERGKAMEAEARAFYEFMHDAECQRVGFISRNIDKIGMVGCSPDSLIGTNRVLEVKTCLPHILIELISEDKFPPAHKAQCQGILWLTEREEVDIVCYWPKLPLFVKRATRDDEYITTLAGAVAQFNGELLELVDRIRRYGERGTG